ncbi:MAG: hypothetical protein FJ303_00170 [Planctomycetes bacterium]|nr:hypothetical protein [Planctomycetota bacterium]
MKKILAWLIVPALFAGLGILVYAQERDMGVTRGKVLLLKTGHAMEGDIERIRGKICVRRGDSEVWIAEDRIVRLCADWDDAFAFAMSTIDPNSANDRVRLARWCHLHKLNDKALAQARLALQLQASHSDALQLVAVLERMKDAPLPKTTATKPASVPRPVEATPSVDLSFETQVAFANKVQPILMNKCVNCHGNNAGGKLHLDRVSDQGKKSVMQRNLAAVLPYIDIDRPAISPLMVKAITAHGDAPAAFRDRSDMPIQAMHQWIVETIAKNPQLRDYRASKKPANATLPAPKSAFPVQQGTTAPAGGVEVQSQQRPRIEIDEKNPPQVQPMETPRTPLAATPVDDFDALHYNQWAHPHLYRQQSASNRP